jgi:hypothetical protein
LRFAWTRAASIAAGRYDVSAWHPTLGKQEATVTIQAKSLTTANFSFAAKQ